MSDQAVQALLDFLNSAKTPQEIVERFLYAKIDEALALKILKLRDGQPGKKFQSIENFSKITEIKGSQLERLLEILALEQALLDFLNNVQTPQEIIDCFANVEIDTALAQKLLELRDSQQGQKFQSIETFIKLTGMKGSQLVLLLEALAKAEQAFLDFLNNVQTPQEIVERFPDAEIDIGHAQKLLELRNSLQGQTFPSFDAFIKRTGMKGSQLVQMLDALAKTERAIMDFLNGVELTPKEIESFSERIDINLAEKLLEFRNSQPEKKIKSLAIVKALLEANVKKHSDIAQIIEVLRMKLGLFRNDLPVFMLPVRIETRYMKNGLCVRIYPDEVFVDTHEPRLSKKEQEAGQKYIDEVNKVPQGRPNYDNNSRAAWRRLAQLFGPERAAWIALKSGDGTAEIQKGQRSLIIPPRIMALPYCFVVYAFRSDGKVIRAAGKPIPSNLTLPVTASEDDPQSSWVADYDQARAVGMAVTIPLSSSETPDSFSRIVVVGVRSGREPDSLEKLIETHHYSTGLGFLKSNTPTNNTQTTKSGHSASREDREASYDIEVADIHGWNDSAANGGHLRHALGLDDESRVFSHIAFAENTVASYAREMQTALWPATGDFFLRYLLSGTVPDDGLKKLAWHIINYVRAAGSLPTIRIGDQPYGLLPVTSLQPKSQEYPNGWAPSLLDNEGDEKGIAFDAKLHDILTRLYPRWKERADNPECVPRIATDGDPDRQLLEILAMEPQSAEYLFRPLVDEGLTDWLAIAMREEAFGANTPFHDKIPNTLTWAKKWVKVMNTLCNEKAIYWSKVTGVHPAQLSKTSLFHSSGWWCKVDINSALGRKPEKKGQDDEMALLRELLDRAYKLAKLPQDPPVAPETVLAAIDTLRGLEITDEDGLLVLFRSALEPFSHRLDAWFTSLATKRLTAMRSKTSRGLYLGAYGYVEDLKPEIGERPNAGYLLAPSMGQATAAAVLHNAYLTHHYSDENGKPGPNPFCINLTSQRVRQTLDILEGIRQGQPLGALLGYQFEKRLLELGLAQYIDEFRAAFPLVANKEQEQGEGESVEALAARNVVDGLALARWNEKPDRTDITPPDVEAIEKVMNIMKSKPSLNEEVRNLQGSLDAVSDLMLYEGVYHAARGNYERCGAALDVLSGNASPQDIESVATPVTGKSLGHRMCLLFPKKDGNPEDPRAEAEPRISAWYADLLGDLGKIGCRYQYRLKDATLQNGTMSLSLKDLEQEEQEEFNDCAISAIDLLYMSASPPNNLDVLNKSPTFPPSGQTEIEQRIAYWVRKEFSLGPDERVDISFSRPDGFEYGIAEALELGRQVLNTLGAGQRLRPSSLCPPGEPAPDTYDVKDLEDRVNNAKTKICQLITTLDKAIGDGSDGTIMPSEVIKSLLKTSRYGVSGSIPPSPDEPVEALNQRRMNVLVELMKRKKKCEALSNTQDVESLINAMKALFGEGFQVLPTFSPPQLTPDENKPEEKIPIPQVFDQVGLLCGKDGSRVRLWLQQASVARPAMREMEDCFIVTELWRQPTDREANPPLTLHVAQLPLAQGAKWFALDDAERGFKISDKEASARGTVSIVAALAGAGTIPDEPMAGLLMDQWDELIPGTKITAGVSFHYNGPSSQAPQCLLLAVPGQRGAKRDLWHIDELAGIVADTMDLAKIRAVDPDAMAEGRSKDPETEGLGLMLPALLLSLDPDRPDSKRKTSDTIKEWIRE